MLLDMHVMAADADADKIVENAKKAGLDGICLVGLDELPAADLVDKVRKGGVKVFTGVEASLEKGRTLLFPGEEGTDWAQFRNALPEGGDLVAHARNAGFAVAACHPYHKESPAAMGDWLFQFVGFHAVVVVTAGSPRAANDMAADALEGVGAAAAAGSAAPEPSGKVATLFVADIETQTQLVEEMKAGDFWAATFGAEERWSVFEKRVVDDDRRRGGRGRFGSRDRGRGRDRDRGRGRDRDRGRGRDRNRGGNRGRRDGRTGNR